MPIPLSLTEMTTSAPSARASKRIQPLAVFINFLDELVELRLVRARLAQQSLGEAFDRLKRGPGIVAHVGHVLRLKISGRRLV